MEDEKATPESLPTLPEGTVTFLFTDIEGSTQLLQRLQDQYAQVLESQRVILRTAFEKWGGREVDAQGDSFFVAFPSALDAIHAAAEIQKKLNVCYVHFNPDTRKCRFVEHQEWTNFTHW